MGELAPAARALFAALALVLAGGEMVLLGPRPAPAEPTHSLGATVLVLLGQQITDAARFLVLALAVSTAAPLPAGLGGAVGSMAGLAVVWTAPGLVATTAARHARRLIGAGLLVLGLGLGLPNVLGLT
ncbi:hypothetical protein ACFOON_03105 [Novosphingobium piscinae]|uniref:hypothetical protein n=1 Tax=Novosphingobium piscinae TaxID=1507448 RepID=UPI001FE99745|nr:hypothetical protein [Novosphingobium piscinae]